MDTVIPFPPTADGGGLRRRNVPRQEPDDVDDTVIVPPEEPEPVALPRETQRERRARMRNTLRQEAIENRKKFSRTYCMVSAVAAFLAIVIAAPEATPPTSSPSKFLDKPAAVDTGVVDLNVVENVAKAAAMGLKTTSEPGEASAIEQSIPQQKATREEGRHYQFHPQPSELDQLIQSLRDLMLPSPKEDLEHEKESSKKHHHNRHAMPIPFKWLFHVHNENNSDQSDTQTPAPSPRPHLSFNLFLMVIDPAILHPSPSTMTDIFDKLLSSNMRLICLANLLLSMTFMFYTVIANLFLGSDPSIPREFGFLSDEQAIHNTSNEWTGRERIGGFLVFKLLLISAVVVPDKLDLMILLSWYTLLSFLRSLAHLAAATTAHTSQSGQPPRKGVLHLLLAVLLSDLCAAAVCVALFHGAGWGMVLLLACDCALLGVEVLCHILRHASQALEERHADAVRRVEDRQLELHRFFRDASNSSNSDWMRNDSGMVDRNRSFEQQREQEEEESRQLDRRMEAMEGSHSRHLVVLDAAIFFLEIIAYTITFGHFCHIWSLHGLHFTLIDGVLALHLHSAISSLGKRIAERRNLNRVARALDDLFENATEKEMRKASANGDVCCICLGTMTVGHVKKVGCGHLYHTRCLREVVERARSIEAAKCPLCRASVVDGRHSDGARTSTNVVVQPPQEAVDDRNANADQPRALGENAQPRQPEAAGPVVGPGQNNNNNNNNAAGGRERALFRFSTENIIPAWLPLPALSFEVVRRPNGVAPQEVPAADNNGGELQQRQQIAAPQELAATGVVARNNGQRPPPERAPSFWRRLLLLSGAIPMSAEEEAIALEQLVDMFPQYERADLQRELRQRGSSEAVVEAVLQGAFSGVARGGAVDAPLEIEDDLDEGAVDHE